MHCSFSVFFFIKSSVGILKLKFQIWSSANYIPCKVYPGISKPFVSHCFATQYILLRMNIALLIQCLFFILLFEQNIMVGIILMETMINKEESLLSCILSQCKQEVTSLQFYIDTTVLTKSPKIYNQGKWYSHHKNYKNHINVCMRERGH